MSNYITENEETLNEWVAFYDKTGTFPKKKVPCSVTGTEVTMFGTNLTKRVQAFGGARELLLNFKSREAKRTEKEATGKTVRTPRTSNKTSVDVDSTVAKAKSARTPKSRAIPVPTVEQLTNDGTVAEEVWQGAEALA